jgi:hypothetical protein
LDAAKPVASSRRPAPDGAEADSSDPERRVRLTDRVAALTRRILPTRSRADTAGWLVAWFLIVTLGVQVAAIVLDNLQHDLWPAYDTYAYWLAARHILSGEPLYAPALIWTAGAYKYPPIFAQLVLPIGLLPQAPVDWVWRIFGLMCLRYMCGCWPPSNGRS